MSSLDMCHIVGCICRATASTARPARMRTGQLAVLAGANRLNNQHLFTFPLMFAATSRAARLPVRSADANGRRRLSSFLSSSPPPVKHPGPSHLLPRTPQASHCPA
jgi:hypothetical protein